MVTLNQITKQHLIDRGWSRKMGEVYVINLPTGSILGSFHHLDDFAIVWGIRVYYIEDLDELVPIVKHILLR